MGFILNRSLAVALPKRTKETGKQEEEEEEEASNLVFYT